VLRVVHGEAPDAFDDLAGERPDAIFLGGGLSGSGLLTRCLGHLAPGGRLVANVVTLEGERILADAHAAHGGRLTRLAVAHAEPLGAFTGWRPAMAITQWELRVR
jgi:precorrin-6Y C5,15-methyltransferase (decarboxylating)